jgi:ribosomal protein S18 acetylase RimI-like enzyme
MSFLIRNYHPSDLPMIYNICLLTGDSGKDATDFYNDPEILGHFYAAPYAVYEPELCFIVTNNDKPCGYILGTKNTKEFIERCEQDWFPVLRKRYKLDEMNKNYRDYNIAHRIFEGHVLKSELVNYPAHLHIDLLPETQGQGMGRKLMEVFINKLKELNVTALHLEVGKRNEGAIKFYEKIGFHKIYEYEYSIAFGMKF